MASYNLIGQRILRKYTAPHKSPTYAATIEAQTIVESLCAVPWQKVADRAARMTYHTEENVGSEGAPISGLEQNVRIRDQFDAALFCAEHRGGQHRAYANAAVYHYVLPDGSLPKLTRLVAKVTSDPYNAAGARIALLTNATGEIPTNCNACRTGDAHAEGVAPRTVASNGNWLPTRADCIFSATPAAGEVALPSGGLPLQKHLFVFVLMESYSTVRGNWLEGCSFIQNLIEIETDAAVPGWTDGGTYEIADVETPQVFDVVKGGVMADMPSGDNGIRAITIQRTGDDFVRNRVVSDTGLFGRPRVDGLRVLDVTSTDAVFREPLFAGQASGVRVMPGLTPLIRTDVGSTASYYYTLVVGDFADGTFPDLPGLLWVWVNNGVPLVARYETRLDALATGDSATRLAALKAAIKADGGIRGAWIDEDLNTSPSRRDLYIATKSGYYGAGGVWSRAISFTLGVSDVASVTVYDGSIQDAGGDVVVAPLKTSSSYIRTAGVLLAHDVTGARIGCPITDKWVSYVGDVTAIRPINFSSSAGVAAVIVSGRLQSVGGVACNNCAIVRFEDNGGGPGIVTVPACDADITPDTYADYAVSCPCGTVANVSTFYVTGAFRRLGSTTAALAARWSGGTLSPMMLPDGTRPPEYFLQSDSFGDNRAIWIDDSGAVTGAETAEDVWETPKAAVTDAQSAFGLRRLYAALYGGALQAPVVVADKRPGAAFVVHGDEITVKTADGDVAARRWGLSSASLMIPFSCPRAWAASRIRLAWSAVAATEGSRVRVWLARGKYLTSYPTSYPKELFTGEAKSVAGWELVGTVEPTGGAAGTATLDVKPIMNDVATLLFVAYIGQDDLNPSDVMTLPRGIGTLDVDLVAGVKTGLDGGFFPDVTLLDG